MKFSIKDLFSNWENIKKTLLSENFVLCPPSNRNSKSKKQWKKTQWSLDQFCKIQVPCEKLNVLHSEK